MRTIAGLGSWTGWVTSYEMEICMPLGYKFEVFNGYKFNKQNIFKNYVEKLYNIRMNYPKSDPMNLIAKLLMNSLYGKFGMKSESNCVEIFNSRNSSDVDSLQNLQRNHAELIQDIIRVGNHFIISTRKKHYQYNEKEDIYHGLDVNVAIASTVTAWARSIMSGVKNNPEIKVYYTDTDSIITNKPLKNSLVGNLLGQFKLEYVIDKAVFLAPKVYGLITESGEQIIKIKGLTKDAVKDISFN